MVDVDEVAANSLSNWVKTNCTHKITAIGTERVCRPCAINWATSGCYTAVLIERENCAKVVEAFSSRGVRVRSREQIASAIRDQTLAENFGK